MRRPNGRRAGRYYFAECLLKTLGEVRVCRVFLPSAKPDTLAKNISKNIKKPHRRPPAARPAAATTTMPDPASPTAVMPELTPVTPDMVSPATGVDANVEE